MENITIKDLIDLIRTYNEVEIEYIMGAYEIANEIHKNQTRQSGEPYITHPLSVAYILAEMRADKDTICAALLHDVIEDSNIEKEEIAKLLNQDIANLVDGVTKISKLNFSSKQEQNLANTRKIITGITEDVRIIIIKLADRLHNMRTLEYKSEFKQKENALETIELYVPLAYYIGAYRLKSELEDLSLKYLKPKVYEEIKDSLEKVKIESDQTLKKMLFDISLILENEKINHEIKIRTKNIYGVYKKLTQNYKLLDIHDLLSLKIMVDDVKDCYQMLRVIHSIYPPINHKFKDYISMPKTNMYQSLHSTVFGPNDKIVQTQIRTFSMDKIASFGLTAYWDENKGLARSLMQSDLNKKFQFFKSLREVNEVTSDNQEFILEIKNELFSNNIYVYTTKGDIIQLPKGSTPIDFAYRIHTDVGNTMVEAIVNNRHMPIDYILQNKDRVKIVTDNLSFGPREDWLDKAYTSYAKSKIKEFKKKIIDRGQ
jgi:GTP diphosphokinase / guanosine-3',5'-bis(diphosphate) 3'-diphosphatase